MAATDLIRRVTMALALGLAPSFGYATPNSSPSTELVTDRDELGSLERLGANARSVLGAGFPSLVGVVNSFVQDERRAFITRFGRGSGRGAFFDTNWLIDGHHGFPLVGFTYRYDARLWQKATCGEGRFLYRLASSASPYPMTLSVVYPLPKDALSECRSFEELTALDVARVVLARRFEAEAVEVNFQVSKLPAYAALGNPETVRYVLLSLRRDAKGRFEVGPLRNTPDVERIRGDATLRAKLEAWLADPRHLAEIADGTYTLPTEFLATSAVSVAPFGPLRKINRPFASLLTDGDSDLAWRLDGGTCQGCHQARSVAGFHFLGNPAQLRSALSPHFQAHLKWRVEHRAAVFAGKSVVVPSPFRLEQGANGELCDIASERWPCAGGLRCSPASPDTGQGVGFCTETPAGALGDSCDATGLATTPSALDDRYLPPATGANPRGCGFGTRCATNLNGFPGGLCVEHGCGDDESYGHASPYALVKTMRCTNVPVLGPFSACLLRTKDFAACAAKHSVKAWMPACDEARPCRPDYACAEPAGACLPTYTLPELAVDLLGQ